ncbi:hypothetical protein CYY_009920 [Polysphondylium violaceum]|uniref:Pesticidal crystal protein N-terminal domain-containing protein n=1 Tax=Polysphondylium violaceum TaxID=133409 RepID=A0A8J4UUZ7_9MYCE|nr:hypothetical protein CYY_009920 [Polysphondylium violaceum]
MAKRLGSKIKSTSDAFLSSTKENVKEKYNGVVDELKEDPFSIIDIEMVGEIFNDPLGFIGDLVTDKEFIGEMIGAAIECIPVVGPILSSIFSIFWPQDPKMKAVTVEELDEKLAEFKEEMVKIMDDKIKASEIETWKELCKAFFECYIFKITQMKKSVVILKKEIKDHKGVIADVPEATKERIRVTFISLLESSNNISNFCKRQKITSQVIEIYMQTIFLQFVSMIQLCSFWYQIDLDKYYILGVKKEEEGDVEVKCIKQEYHDLLVECLKNITPAVHQNLVDEKPELNKYYNNNASVMFNKNPWIYPIPLVIAPLNVPRIPTEPSLRTSIPTINVPLEQKTPFIYRIDGANMLPQPTKEWDKSFRPIPEIDPLTKCYGTFIHLSNSINISLPERKNVTIRIFGIYPKSVSNLSIGKKQFLKQDSMLPTLLRFSNLSHDEGKLLQQECVQESMFCLPPNIKNGKNFDGKIENSEQPAGFQTYLESYGGKSGFTYLKQYSHVNIISLNIGQVSTDSEINNVFNWGCIKFIELIISDLNAKDLQEIKHLESQIKEKSAKLKNLHKTDNFSEKEYKELSSEVDKLKASLNQGS